MRIQFRNKKLNAGAALALGAVLALSACGDDGGVKATGQSATATTQVGGKLAGAGASSIESATTAWTQSFKAVHPEASITYDSVGSGKGREQFLAAAVAFAGSDAPLKTEELAKAKERCYGGEAYDLPVYISPIAVVFKLDGIKELNLAPETLAGIFSGQITRWNDAKIAADNPGVQLPDLAIVPVHRSDKSGTTENFTEYLHAAAPGAWEHKPAGKWPLEGGQSGDGTSGLISVVEGGNGTIGYADASKAGNLATAAIKVGDKFVKHSAAGAAKAVEVSPRDEGRSPSDIVIKLDRNTKDAEAYPLVLVSYLVVCNQYEKAEEAELVKAFVSYVVSDAGQKTAQEMAGSAPLSPVLSGEVKKVAESIKAKQ